MSVTFSQDASARPYGLWLIAIAAAIGFILSLVVYFTPHGPIADSWGALLVLCSTALMLIAALFLLAAGAPPRWLAILLSVLIVLDIAGTGVAAYFLEAHFLLAFMVVALIGWIVHPVSASSRTAGN